MAVNSVEDWYEEYQFSENRGGVYGVRLRKEAEQIRANYGTYKSAMDTRTADYHKLIAVADGEVANPKEDLANVSSGETSGIVHRTGRMLVQNTPNVEVVSKFDDGTAEGIFADYVLRNHIIGSERYTNDMQQNLFASTKNAFTIGYDCVVPVLVEEGGDYYIRYDSIYYADVMPDPGAKDIRDAAEVYVRRFLSKPDVRRLLKTNAPGWEREGLITLLESQETVKTRIDHQSKKHSATPKGYEIVTWYNSYGDPFVTFEAKSGVLLRIERNRDPLKRHPVFFLVLEKDLNQPLGKSQVERIYGRQAFQDLMLNGAMKAWWRNINPPLIGYGAANAVPNLSPGKYTQVSNPNARIEPFEVSTQTLLQFNNISQANAGNMIQIVGAGDQQMAAENGPVGMSKTPQGVEAQNELVDSTIASYQKAIEGFFSAYCSYALTLYFHELKGVSNLVPNADARRKLIEAGMPAEYFTDTGEISLSYADMATQYYVNTVHGSLVELEDEKQIRILNELFVPLSQAMPAIAATQDAEAIHRVNATMQYIIQKQLELSGSSYSRDLANVFRSGDLEAVQAKELLETATDESVGTLTTTDSLAAMREQIQVLTDQVMVLIQTNAFLMGDKGTSPDQFTGGGAPDQPQV